MTGIGLIVCFVIAVALMIFMIAKWRVHPFLALMAVSLALALVANLPLASIPSIIGDGFSAIFKSIGIVIIFGAIIGTVLEKTGAALKLADMVVRRVGEKRPELAMLLMGWIVGIPVFCDSGFVVLNPIREAIRKKLLAHPAALAVALSAGLYAAHVFIPPTPGPIAAAASVGLEGNLLLVIGVGILVSLPVLLASYLFAKYISKQMPLAEQEQASDAEVQQSYEDLLRHYGRLPNALLSLAPIVLPIFFMALSSVVKIAGFSGGFAQLCLFLGSSVIALAIGVSAAIVLLADTGKMPQFNQLTNDTLQMVGPILLITAAGGVLGNVITQAGFVQYIKENAQNLSSVGIFFPFLISAILKTAQGSSTVAIITTASIMGMFHSDDSMMTALGLNTEMAAALTVMAIASGAMCISHANDSYFWVVTNFSKLTPQQGYRTQTALTFIMGITGILSVYVLSLLLI